MLTRAGKEALRQMRQLDLFLELRQADPTADQHLLPWDGRSPRDLTATRKGISLGHEGASLNTFADEEEEMCRRHLHGW